MEKTKIAICFRDREYQNRFIKCWLHHFETRYELHVFASVDEIVKCKESMVLLVEGVLQEEVDVMAQKKRMVLCLLEDKDISNDTYENVMLTPKYQQVYKVEQLLREWLQKDGVALSGKTTWQAERKQIGVFSLDLEIFQIPFCAMTAAEYGEKSETVLLDFQMASGLDAKEDEKESLSMEDLLVAATTMQYSKNRILDGIMREQNWDYVTPVKNAVHLAETDSSIYKNLIQILIKEIGYEVIILNFGITFTGMFELMQQCDELYLLVPQKCRVSRREEAFRLELEQLGKEELLQKVVRIEISSPYSHYEPWRKLAQKWRWDCVGDQLRRHMQVGT